ncbi:hypothetical protein OG799_04770 [Micromonospora sp. NBC_00898]|uniref:hypothetical protein n=1 Tax=Micromonospora sp. NBC_00898 TaxID=2975981 RepID=UPI0038675EBD|nr:hypothetical protein OG799_04770 [Micromonospora sp. NBC_00898]
MSTVPLSHPLVSAGAPGQVERDDADYARGLRRVRAAADRTPTARVVDTMDLLVLR